MPWYKVGLVPDLPWCMISFRGLLGVWEKAINVSSMLQRLYVIVVRGSACEADGERLLTETGKQLRSVGVGM